VGLAQLRREAQQGRSVRSLVRPDETADVLDDDYDEHHACTDERCEVSLAAADDQYRRFGFPGFFTAVPNAILFPWTRGLPRPVRRFLVAAKIDFQYRNDPDSGRQRVARSTLDDVWAWLPDVGSRRSVERWAKTAAEHELIEFERREAGTFVRLHESIRRPHRAFTYVPWWITRLPAQEMLIVAYLLRREYEATGEYGRFFGVRVTHEELAEAVGWAPREELWNGTSAGVSSVSSWVRSAEERRVLRVVRGRPNQYVTQPFWQPDGFVRYPGSPMNDTSWPTSPAESWPRLPSEPWSWNDSFGS